MWPSSATAFVTADPFRRYIVKRIETPPGRQASLWEGGHRYWIFVTNDHVTDAAALEAEHRQKATVQTGMAERTRCSGICLGYP